MIITIIIIIMMIIIILTVFEPLKFKYEDGFNLTKPNYQKSNIYLF